MLYHRRMKPIVLPAEIAPYVTAAADAMFALGLSGHARELRRSPAHEHIKKAATAATYREILGIDGATAALTALLALADVIGAGDYVRACVERERHHVAMRREADANGTRVSLAAMAAAAGPPTCRTKKRGHATREAAEEALRGMGHVPNASIGTYACSLCGAWHVGRV